MEWKPLKRGINFDVAKIKTIGKEAEKEKKLNVNCGGDNAIQSTDGRGYTHTTLMMRKICKAPLV